MVAYSTTLRRSTDAIKHSNIFFFFKLIVKFSDNECRQFSLKKLIAFWIKQSKSTLYYLNLQIYTITIIKRQNKYIYNLKIKNININKIIAIQITELPTENKLNWQD